MEKSVTVDKVTDSVNKMKIQLTYVDQAVPSMIRMPPFEEYYNNSSQNLNVYWKLINEFNLLLPSDEVYFSGKRGSCYQLILRECDVVSHDIIKFFTGYNLTEDKLKR